MRICHVYIFLIGLIVYEIRQLATLPSRPYYPSFPYIIDISILDVTKNRYMYVYYMLLLLLLLFYFGGVLSSQELR